MQRINAPAVAPDLFGAMLALEKTVQESGLEKTLIHLVKLRASQLNGCAYCLEMHTREARADVESDLRIDLLPAWREALCYTDRERAALGWTEALSLVADTHAPDVDFEPLRGSFSEREIVALSLAIVTINGWNRLAIGFRTPPMARKARAPSGTRRGRPLRRAVPRPMPPVPARDSRTPTNTAPR